MSRSRSGLYLYVFSITSVYLGLEFWSFEKYRVEDVFLSTVFLLIGTVFEFFRMNIPTMKRFNVSVSGGMTINIISALLLNPFEASTIAGLSVLVSRMHLLKRVPPIKFAFNVSQIGLSTMCAALMSKFMGGFKGYQDMIIVVVVAVVYMFSNMFFVSLVVYLSSSENIIKTIKRTFVLPFSYLLLVLPSTVVVLVLYRYIGVVSVPLALVLLMTIQIGLYYRKMYEDAKIENMMILAKSLEEKDRYTYGHGSKVAEISEKIAREMGFSEKHVDRIKTAALLHDIGKIGIPDPILNKAGRLTDEEYETIKKHPVIGWEILKSLKRFEKKEALWVRHHHERMDGRGYPDGLIGDQIPIESRIIAVADVFDALRSDRPYRKAIDLDRAMSIIERMAGDFLDPDVVEILRRLIERGDIA